MLTITATIKGTMPMLLHRFSVNAEADVQAATRKNAAAGAQNTPREEAERCVYRDPKDNCLCIPGAAIARLLRDAGGNHKIKGSRKNLKYLVPAAVRVPSEVLRLTNGDGETPLKDYEVDSRPVTIPATKGRIMRHRGRVDCWSVVVNLLINETLIKPDMVHQLLTEGGEQIGLGDFRPERGGPFGVFQTIAWQG